MHNKSLSALCPSIIVFLISLKGISPSGLSYPSTCLYSTSTVLNINFVK